MDRKAAKRAIRQAKVVFVHTCLCADDSYYIQATKDSLYAALTEMPSDAEVEARWRDDDPGALYIG